MLELFEDWWSGRGWRRWWCEIVVRRVKWLGACLNGLIDTAHDIWLAARIHWNVISSLIAQRSWLSFPWIDFPR